MKTGIKIVRTLLIGTTRKDSVGMGMAEYKGKVNHIKDTPLVILYQLLVVNGKWLLSTF